MSASELPIKAIETEENGLRVWGVAGKRMKHDDEKRKQKEKTLQQMFTVLHVDFTSAIPWSSFYQIKTPWQMQSTVVSKTGDGVAKGWGLDWRREAKTDVEICWKWRETVKNPCLMWAPSCLGRFTPCLVLLIISTSSTFFLFLSQTLLHHLYPHPNPCLKSTHKNTWVSANISYRKTFWIKGMNNTSIL